MAIFGAAVAILAVAGRVATARSGRLPALPYSGTDWVSRGVSRRCERGTVNTTLLLGWILHAGWVWALSPFFCVFHCMLTALLATPAGLHNCQTCWVHSVRLHDPGRRSARCRRERQKCLDDCEQHVLKVERRGSLGHYTARSAGAVDPAAGPGP